jgi:sugar lactone lactonase YvrE
VPFDLGVELVLPAGALVAEGPLWDPRDSTLLWVDVDRGEVHRLSPDTGVDSVVAASDRPVGVAVWRRSGGLALALRGGVALLAEGGDVSAAQLVPVEADSPDQQMNDGACDRQGRFWAGTASASGRPGTSALYRLGADRRLEQVLSGVSMSNGLGWSPDDRAFYYVDSATQRLDVFDHDPDSGRLDRRRPLVSLPRDMGIPDGLAVDVDGCVWLAIWGAGVVHRYTPDGELDGVVHVPVRRVASCAFGGPGLADLYVTTASRGLSTAELAAEPYAGGIFAARPVVGGLEPQGFAG